VEKSYGMWTSSSHSPPRSRAGEDRAHGTQRCRKTTLINALLPLPLPHLNSELRKTSGYDGPFWVRVKSSGDTKPPSATSRKTNRSCIEKAPTIFDWLFQWDPSVANEDIRGLLGQMLFPRDEAMKKTDVLSGGEAARILFCKAHAAETERARVR